MKETKIKYILKFKRIVGKKNFKDSLIIKERYESKKIMQINKEYMVHNKSNNVHRIENFIFLSCFLALREECL